MTRPPPHLIVTYLVTYDGEPQHPMDTYAVRVDLDDGQPTAEAMKDLVEHVSRALSAKALQPPRRDLRDDIAKKES